MKTVIQEMVETYHPKNLYEQKNAMKEVMQEIILYGLSQANFFKKAAFYGGTALRIFYGLDRFSEDLDFSLLIADNDFNLASYFPLLQDIVESFGLKVEIETKMKSIDSNTKSAFLKGDTNEQFLLFYPDTRIQGINKNERIKIKFEIDINPPKLASYEIKYRLLPAPYEIRLYDQGSLFAGKLHAILCRAWVSRVKGRDLYDYVFYLTKNIPFNLSHLRERLLQTSFITEEDSCTLETVKKMLIDKFNEIDFDEAKKDVEPFIKNTNQLTMWNADFFIQITDKIISN